MDNTYIVIGLIILLIAGLFLAAISDWNIQSTQYRLIARLFGTKAAKLYFILPVLIILVVVALALIMLRVNGYKF
jgi:uncharacterized membrane protein